MPCLLNLERYLEMEASAWNVELSDDDESHEALGNEAESSGNYDDHDSDRIESLDFSRSSSSVTPAKQNVPDEKCFIVQRKFGDKKKQMIRFSKADTSVIFEKVAKKFDIREKYLSITYPIKKAGDAGTLEVTIEYEEDPESLSESLELF